MSDNYQFGGKRENVLGDSPRYLYALRRTDNGDLYFARVDQLSQTDSIQINNLGTADENFYEFEPGVDMLEGRDTKHNLVFGNLNYEQMRWDERDLYYYIDDDGQLVVRINKKYTYPSGI